MMVRVDPKLYQTFTITSAKGVPILCVRLDKALYGLLKNALLFYKPLVCKLTEYGVKINPYDPCVANKTINGSQMNVT